MTKSHFSWAVPYASFTSDVSPVDASRSRAALCAAGGRVRIHPTSEQYDKYRSIVACSIDQALTEVSDEFQGNEEARKKTKKKYLKQGHAYATQLLEQEMQLDVSIVDVEVVVEASDIIASDGCLSACLLDAGCSKIVTRGDNIQALDAAKIPADRLVAHFVYHHYGEAQLQQAIAAASQFCSSVSIELCNSDDISESVMLNILEQCCCCTGSDDADESSSSSSNKLQVVFVFAPSDCIAMLDPDLATLVADIGRQSDNRARVALVNPTAEQLGLSFAACLKTDRPDGLYTTVVCTRNGEALGLVYSSAASLVASLECGRGVYFSRSRHGLWRKGDTSGHYQTLHRIDVDCDGDALRFCVTQRGDDHAAFCHLNTLTCWGKPKGLRHLEEALQHRLQNAPEGSYTKRLFDDETLLRDKLVEEAQELAEATEPDDVASELADVLYFAMTRAVKAGVSMDDAVAVLDKRAHKVTRRQGDSKAFRIAAGQAILEKKQQQAKES